MQFLSKKNTNKNNTNNQYKFNALATTKKQNMFKHVAEIIQNRQLQKVFYS